MKQKHHGDDDDDDGDDDDDDDGDNDDDDDDDDDDDGKPSVTFSSGFSAPAFGSRLTETETVKFINNFRLLVTVFGRSSR